MAIDAKLIIEIPKSSLPLLSSKPTDSFINEALVDVKTAIGQDWLIPFEKIKIMQPIKGNNSSGFISFVLPTRTREFENRSLFFSFLNNDEFKDQGIKGNYLFLSLQATGNSTAVLSSIASHLRSNSLLFKKSAMILNPFDASQNWWSLIIPKKERESKNEKV